MYDQKCKQTIATLLTDGYSYVNQHKFHALLPRCTTESEDYKAKSFTPSGKKWHVLDLLETFHDTEIIGQEFDSRHKILSLFNFYYQLFRQPCQCICLKKIFPINFAAKVPCLHNCSSEGHIVSRSCVGGKW